MKNLTSRATRLFPILLAAGVLATLTPAFAQPGAGPGMNDNPPNANAGGRGGRGQNGQNGNRAEMQAQMQTQMITRSLQRAGVTDAATIEAVTTYATNRTAARKPLYDAANALTQALADENSTDAQVTTLLDAFNAALDAEKTRTTAAEAELDKQIGYSKNPKLAAALTLLGMTGDASGYLNGGMGGRGGMGGFNGGGRGGRGGQGGNGGQGNNN